MSSTVIKVENLGKQYRLGEVGTGTLSHDLNRWWASIRGKEDPFIKIGENNDRTTRASSEYVWALRNINFEVEAGEVLGIIGRNGAGKSTLLKILSKVTKPTSGRILTKGRIASLLEVGTGFHPEMTGRENIFLNGAIMGMTRMEIRKNFDEIVDFAGVERYIDTPVKRYSSGMYVRLAFAVAAHLEPEILVVDEVLAVGDAEFQKKAIGKMNDVSKEEGRTVLFVSHNMTAVKALCTKGIVLEHGSIAFCGTSIDAINYTLSENKFVESTIISGMSFCNKDINIKTISINGSDSNLVTLSPTQHLLKIIIEGELKSSKKMAVELRIYDSHEKVVAFYSPTHLTGNLVSYPPGVFTMIETVVFPTNLSKGEYFVDIDITHPNYEGYVRILKHIKIVCSGVVGSTGFEFNYSECGLIIL